MRSGIEATAIADGLRSFALDSELNPGRLNLFERRGLLVLVDFAHNEAGLAGLLEVCRKLVTASARASRRGRGKVRLAIGTAGDRTDEILHGLGLARGCRARTTWSSPRSGTTCAAGTWTR